MWALPRGLMAYVFQVLLCYLVVSCRTTKRIQIGKMVKTKHPDKIVFQQLPRPIHCFGMKSSYTTKWFLVFRIGQYGAPLCLRGHPTTIRPTDYTSSSTSVHVGTTSWLMAYASQVCITHFCYDMQSCEVYPNRANAWLETPSYGYWENHPPYAYI